MGSETRAPSAREIAFAVLEESRTTAAFVADVLDRRLNEAAPAANERRLATELVFGITRRRDTLDAIVQPRISRPREKVEEPLWTLLRLGAYQLAFLDSVPSRAAVYETVGLSKRVGEPRWTGFLNGVLRGVDRSLTTEFVTEPAANAVPVAEGRYRRLTESIFESPAVSPTEYVAAAFSLPRWLVARWAARFPFEDLVQLGFWFTSSPRTWLRVNRLRGDRETLVSRLAAANVDVEPGPLPESLRLRTSASIASLPGFDDGAFAVQDVSAMGAATLLDPRPGERVWDMCAAPGTKTTHLAERMGDEGTVLATDVDERRLLRIEENAGRLGTAIVETDRVSDDPASLPDGPFEAVLVDVPCSNTGVLGKRVDVRWRLRPNDLVELPTKQTTLLNAAIDRLVPGGRVVYSTCSIEPEENRNVVDAVLGRRTDVELVRDVEHVPGSPGDGGYQALLRRLPSPTV